MQKFIGKDETLIERKDIFKNGKWLLTKENERIIYLQENYLKKISTCDGGWTILYLDEYDGRYWELFYDESFGDNWLNEPSPSLRHISEEEARKKYKF